MSSTTELNAIYDARQQSYNYLASNRIRQNNLDAFEKFLRTEGNLERSSLIIRCQVNKNEYATRVIVNKEISQWRYKECFLPFLKRMLHRVHKYGEFFVLLSDRLYISQQKRKECSEFLKKVPLLRCDKSPKDELSQYSILIPDFFIQHALYTDELAAIDREVKKIPFHARVNLIKWRGSLTGPDHPTIKTYSQFPRYKLLELSLAHPNILDARLIGYENFEGNEFADELKIELEKKFGKLEPKLSAEAFVNYKYLVSVDGVAAAWKRVPTILASGSALLLQHEWEQFFYPALKPFLHYVPLKHDLSNLCEQYCWLEGNIQKATKIGCNGRRFAKAFLNPVFLEDYFVEIINKCCELYDS